MRLAHRLVLAPALLALALGLTHCGGPASLRAAREGRFSGLDALVASDLKRGAIDAGDAVAIARAVGRLEIVWAKDDAGVAKIRALAGCAGELRHALKRRADEGDAVGAEAAIALMNAGIGDASSHARWAMEPAGGPKAHLRPAGARALVTREDGERRRALMSDPDQEVRAGALLAAVDAVDPADLEPVLESARVDPYPKARLAAIRAAGAIGGERAATALKDLWPAATEEARSAIVAAWATPATLGAGGRHELAWATETTNGKPAFAAALALVAIGGEAEGSAIGVIARAIEAGPTPARVHAVEAAPLAIGALGEAITKAEADPDATVAVAAEARLLTSAGEPGGARPDERAALITKLEQAASADDADHARAARLALAKARVPAVLPLLDKDAASTDPKLRAAAAVAFVAMGELGRAAVLAADKDADVRLAAVIALLKAPRR